jgi:hypothetical protein
MYNLLDEFQYVLECIKKNQIEKAKDSLKELDEADKARSILGMLEANEIFLAHETLQEYIYELSKDEEDYYV